MKVTSSSKYRLGLDLGTNSIGWAAVTLDDQGRPCGVLDMGVRIYPDGRNPTDNSSNAVARRVARGQRRRRDRYLARRGEMMRALMEFGLMPPDAEAREELQRLDPYSLRARALAEPLHPFELGRALFHLNQRRGFKSNRKSGGEEEEDQKKLGAAIAGLRLRIQESGARTLGEFLARRNAQKETVRAREALGLYPERAMYEEEFDSIRQEQREHHNLSSEQWNVLRNIIFHQRPLRPVEPGWCQFEFENRERRAARALPIFQAFRILQEVNNLRVQVGSEQARPLAKEEREGALERLRSGKDIDFRKPTRDLRLPSDVSFNLARGGRQKIKGDEVAVRLGKKELFGSLWHGLSLKERNAIVAFLLDTEDPESVKHKAMAEWGLTASQAKAVAAVSLPTGYGDLSEKAIRKILPHLERGSLYSDAVREAGYSHHSDFRSDAALDRLPYYGEILQRDAIGADPTKDPLKDGEEVRYGRFPNPTVHIGLNQLRRVVNRLIEIYGKPEEIAVELARDLKSNREQRLTYQRRQREGRERNQRFTEMLEAAGQEPSPDIFRKLRLWEEQGAPQARVCPYTGRNLSFGMVISSQTEVDHILPFSKTLDDSMANKVVCIAAANRDKGDRAPYGAFGHSPPGYDYQKILDATVKFPANKRWRFRDDAMGWYEDGAVFLDRQLNETRYLSRTARAYLAHLYDEKGEGRRRVMATPGHLTALLRRAWGLEGMLRAAPDTGEIVRKQRDDHRHHAIDAFIIANTTEGLLQRFARAAASSHHVAVEKLGSLVPDPWEGFRREQLRPILDRLVVSYKPDHGTRGVPGKTTGQLHNDTAYGLVALSEDGPSQVVRRKKLSTLKRRSELDAVRDCEMRKALIELWEQVESEIGAKGGKASEAPGRFAERAASDGVLLGGRRQTVRRVRVLEHETVIPIRDRSGRPYKGYKRGGNEFADVWRMRDGSWKMVIVPTFEANQPDFDLEEFRPKDRSGRRDPTAKRLMRLHRDDMGAIGDGPCRRIVRIRKMWTERGGRSLVVLDDHNEANVDKRARDKRDRMKENKYSARQLQHGGFRKVGVDEIGRVLDPGPPRA